MTPEQRRVSHAFMLKLAQEQPEHPWVQAWMDGLMVHLWVNCRPPSGTDSPLEWEGVVRAVRDYLASEKQIEWST